MLEWRGGGLPLSEGMGCADAFTCPCGRPKIHGDRTSVAYSTSPVSCVYSFVRHMNETQSKVTFVM